MGKWKNQLVMCERHSRDTCWGRQAWGRTPYESLLDKEQVASEFENPLFAKTLKPVTVVIVLH